MNLFPVPMLFPAVPENRSFHVVPLFPPPTGGNRRNGMNGGLSKWISRRSCSR